jgi:hypothetical protein
MDTQISTMKIEKNMDMGGFIIYVKIVELKRK